MSSEKEEKPKGDEPVSEKKVDEKKTGESAEKAVAEDKKDVKKESDKAEKADDAAKDDKAEKEGAKESEKEAKVEDEGAEKDKKSEKKPALAKKGSKKEKKEAAEKKEEESKKVITVHCTPEGLHAPSTSPFVMKLETYLRFAKLDYVIDAQPTGKNDSPKGKVPWITVLGNDVYDTHHIFEYFRKRKVGTKIDLDHHLNEMDKAVSRAFRELVESHLYFARMAAIYTKENEKFVREIWGVSGFIANRKANSQIAKYRKQAFDQGMGRHTQAEILEFAQRDLRALSIFLGTKKHYFFGDKPSTLDTAVFGALVQVFYHSPPGSKLKEWVEKKLPNLLRYTERIRETYWPDWNEKCKAPIRTTKEQAIYEKEKKEKEAKEKKEKEEKEAKEKKEREEAEAKEKAEKEAKEKEEAEAKEKEAKEKAEKEAKKEKQGEEEKGDKADGGEKEAEKDDKGDAKEAAADDKDKEPAKKDEEKPAEKEKPAAEEGEKEKAADDDKEAAKKKEEAAAAEEGEKEAAAKKKEVVPEEKSTEAAKA